MFLWYTLMNLGCFMGLFGHLYPYFPMVNFPALKGHQQGRHKKRVKKHSSFTLLLLGYGLSWGQASLPWQFLYFLPLPQGQGSLRPILGATLIGSCFTAVSAPPGSNRSLSLAA